MTAKQKKFTIKNNTLLIGFCCVIIRIADAIADAATIKKKITSEFIQNDYTFKILQKITLISLIFN